MMSNNSKKLTKLQLYDEIALKTAYIDSVATLVMLSNNGDEEANLDAVGLMSDLAKEIKQMASEMLRAEH